MNATFSPQIAVVGAAASGKTTLVQFLTRSSSVGKTSPTIGFDMKTVQYRSIKFLITDLGGQKPFVITFWDKILPKTDAIIFLIDAAAPDKFILAYDLFLYVLKKMNNVPMLVLANKQDLENAASVETLTQIFNFEKARMRFGITALHITPTSALKGTGVTEALDWLCKQIVLNAGHSMPLIHDIFIYDRTTGRPLGIISGKKIRQLIAMQVLPDDSSLPPLDEENDLQSLNPSLVSAFYSALGNFSQELTTSVVQSLKLRNSDPMKPDHLLFNFMDDKSSISCLIVATHGDNELMLEFIAERLISLIKEKYSWVMDDDSKSTHHILDLTVQGLAVMGKLIRNSEITDKKIEQGTDDLTWTKDLLSDNLSSDNLTTRSNTTTRENSSTSSIQNHKPRSKEPMKDQVINNDSKNEENQDRIPDKKNIKRLKDFHRLSVRERVQEIEKRRKKRNK